MRAPRGMPTLHEPGAFTQRTAAILAAAPNLGQTLESRPNSRASDGWSCSLSFLAYCGRAFASEAASASQARWPRSDPVTVHGLVACSFWGMRTLHEPWIASQPRITRMARIDTDPIQVSISEIREIRGQLRRRFMVCLRAPSVCILALHERGARPLPHGRGSDKVHSPEPHRLLITPAKSLAMLEKKRHFPQSTNCGEERSNSLSNRPRADRPSLPKIAGRLCGSSKPNRRPI